MRGRVIAYSIFSISLFLWTTSPIKFESDVPYKGYLIGILLLEAATLCIYVCFKENRQIINGVMVAIVFQNIGMSVNYRCVDMAKNVNNNYLVDFILMVIVFVVTYMLVRYTKLYKFKFFNFLILAGMVIAVFGARLSSRMVGGSYLYFAGFMIFGLVLMGFPFVAAWFMSVEENRYFAGKVGNISWNLLGFLLCTFIIYIGCVLCNEFGLLLVLGVTTTILFLVRCKDLKSKILYTAFCTVGTVVAITKTSHLWSRVQIWLNPVKAFDNPNLKGQAESVLYLFRNLAGMGWWGKGIGNLSKRIYPTLNTDHVLILLLNDYSILLFALVLILGVLFVRWMLISAVRVSAYDRYLNLTCGLIFSVIVLIDISSNIGSFITAGIGFPWISDGSAVNIMLAELTAIHCGLLGKKVGENA